MKRFSPETWSMESISPQWSGAFKKDMRNALQEIYNNIKGVADPSADDQKLAISAGVAQKYRNQKARNQLMAPMAEAVAKHTNIVLKEYRFHLAADFNAYAGPATIVFLYTNDPDTSPMLHRAIVDSAGGFKDYMELSRLGQFLDRETGKLRKRIHLDGVVAIHSKFFDLVYSGDVGIDMLTSIMLHEIGHVIDSIDQSLRMTCVSDMAEDMIRYKDTVLDVQTAEQLIDVSTQMINRTKGFSRTLKKQALATLTRLRNTTEDERDDEWVAAVGCIYNIVVREMETNIGSWMYRHFSRTTGSMDSVISDDFYRGAERRADKYASLNMAGDQIVIFCDVLLDATKFMNLMGCPRWYAKLIVSQTYQALVTNTGTYDTHANRAAEILKHKYMLLSEMQKEGSMKGLKETLDQIKFLQGIIKDLKGIEKDLENRNQFLKTISKYGARGLGIFFSRGRLDQNSVLSHAIRETARSSIHGDAARLKALGLESFGIIPTISEEGSGGFWEALGELLVTRTVDDVREAITNFVIHVEIFLEREVRKACPAGEHQEVVETGFTPQKAKLLVKVFNRITHDISTIDFENQLVLKNFLDYIDVSQFEPDRLLKTEFDSGFLDLNTQEITFEQFIFGVKSVQRAMMVLESASATRIAKEVKRLQQQEAASRRR